MKTTKSTIIIRYAKPADKERLTEFCIEQFKTAKEFILVSPELLSYQSGHIFVAELDGKIISTMQVESVESVIHYESISCSQYSSLLDSGYFPAYHLTKAGTVSSLRNAGLNSLLRQLTIESALKNASIKSLTGEVYENGPRLNLLKRLGYGFDEIQLADFDFTKALGKTFFIYLRSNLFVSALQTLQAETEQLRRDFDISLELA